MSQPQSVQDVLLPVDSPEGIEKQRMFTEHRVICANVRGDDPSYRLTWERLHAAVGEVREAMIEELREAEDGERWVEEYLSIPKKPVITVFLEFWTEAFALLLSDYDKRFGFDLDAFLLVDPRRMDASIMHCEFFPRTSEGLRSTAFASGLVVEVPLIRLQTQMVHDTDSVTNLGRFIFDGRPWGGGIDVRNPVIRKFATEKGMWPIVNRVVVADFILNTALSLMACFKGEHQEVISVTSWTDLERMRHKAALEILAAQ